MIRYPIGTSGQVLIVDDPVLARFERHRQVRLWHREAGGQLFATFESSVVRIMEASGPRRGDRRSRFSYVPDRRAEQAEIDERHGRGLHFIGDWHTHPELLPVPSAVDRSSTSDGFVRSRHALNGFILVIVGTAPFPAGLFVAVCDGSSVRDLSYEDQVVPGSAFDCRRRPHVVRL